MTNSYLCISCTQWVEYPQAAWCAYLLCWDCYEEMRRDTAHQEGEHEDEADPFCVRCTGARS